MPEQIETIAENIRAQILALAPDSVHATVEGLPAVAILGAVAAVALLLLWIIFALLGAVFGGGKKKARDEEADEELARMRDYERPADRAPERQAPSRSEPARAAPQGGGPQAVPQSPPPADARGRYDDSISRGDRLSQNNDHAGAVGAYKQALDFARQIAFSQPDSLDAQRLVAKALHKVGDASARAGDAPVARQHHEQALGLLRRLHQSNTRDAGIARELAVTLERIGASASAAGDRHNARGAFEEELRIANAMAQQETNDLTWVRFKAVVHIMLGNLNDQDSRAHYEQARQLFETLERSGSIQSQDAQTLQQLRGVLGAA